jgi:DNA uptake protein ComE-like DNA-binding protein
MKKYRLKFGIILIIACLALFFYFSSEILSKGFLVIKFTQVEKLTKSVFNFFDPVFNFDLEIVKEIIRNLYQKGVILTKAGYNHLSFFINNLKKIGRAEIGHFFEIVPRSDRETVKLKDSNTENNKNDSSQDLTEKESLQTSTLNLKSQIPPSLSELQRQLNEITQKVDELKKKISQLNNNQDKENEELEDEQELEEDELEENDKESVVCPVNINTASAKELQAITGVGPVIASRIIAARPFSSLNELSTKVKGIGSVTLQKIIAQGCAYASGFSGERVSSPPSNQSQPYPKIIISEVQISPIENRFIELYNPNDSQVDLTGWYIQRKTETGTNWSSLVPSTRFEGKTIPAKSYFLIARTIQNSDILLEDLTLTENNSLVLKNPSQEIVDLIGYGNAQDYETATATSPTPSQSIGRKWSATTENYIDTNNNSADFEIQTPTPKSKNQSLQPPQPELEPTNLLLNEFFEEWDEPANSAEHLHKWNYNGTKTHITRSQNALRGDFSVQWIPITSARDLTQTGIHITEAGTYYAEIWIKPLNVDNENYVRVSLDIATSIDGSFPNASFTDYKSETGWVKLTKSRVIDVGEQGGLRIRAERNGATGPSFLIGAAWFGATPPPNYWPKGLPPNIVEDFQIAGFEHNTVTLNWSAATDSDTPSEKLSYKIYYSKDGEITEENLTSPNTFSTVATSTTIIIPDLDYDSVYYFGIKAFDKEENYSHLAITSDFIQIPSAIESAPWPAFRANQQRSGQSAYLGPQNTPEIFWVYNEEINSEDQELNPYYTSPIIRPEGTIISSVISPQDKKGILALTSQGNKKWFRENSTIESTLLLQSDGSVLPDEGKVKNRDGTSYELDGNVIKAIDRFGQEKWQKEIDFEQRNNELDQFSLTGIAISQDNRIYLVAEGKTFSPEQEYVYIYLLDSENGEILLSRAISGGYRAGFPSVALSGNVYITYFTSDYSTPTLYLTAISPSGELLWGKNIGSDYSISVSRSPIIIDNQENLYFAVGKDVFALDKEKNELWRVSLDTLPSNWHHSNIGIALGSDNTLYLTGKGVIFALR